MSNRYYQAFSRLKKEFPRIAQKYCVWVGRLYVDAGVSYVRYGVTPNEYLGWRFYELSNLERKRFYTARDSSKWESRFNDPASADLFNKKNLTNQTFRNFISRKWLYAAEASVEEIAEFLKTGKTIIKPVGLSSGHGIHVAKNDKAEDLVGKEILLEEFVTQHHLLSALNESSVNTIRVYTVKQTVNKCKTEGVIFLSASIRVGGNGAEVDNYHSGGVAYPLDTATGIVSGAGTAINGSKVLFHPGSGMKVIGYQIPNWDGLRQYVLDLNRVVEGARLIAWDIAVLEEGFELIEANYNGDPGLMQAPTQEGKKQIILDNYK